MFEKEDKSTISQAKGQGLETDAGGQLKRSQNVKKEQEKKEH